MAMPRRWRKFWKCRRGLRKVRARAGLGALQAGKEPRQLALARRRPNIFTHFVIEDDQSGRVALIVDGEIEKRGSDKARVVHLFHGRARGVLHGVAGIEQNR